MLELADLNYGEALREQQRWNPAGEIVERGGWLIALGADPFPVGFLNAALPMNRQAAVDSRGRLEEIAALFAQRGRGFTIHVPGHYGSALLETCTAMGLQPFGDTPGMLLEAAVAEPELSHGIELRVVANQAAARDFAEVSARSYATMGLPVGVSTRIFAEPERLLQPHVIAVVAYRHGSPASAAMTILSHGIAGVYWVGTVEEERGAGLGDSCARRVSNAAFERGAAFVVLQASEQGEPIYRRMGYREITRYVWCSTLTPLAAQ